MSLRPINRIAVIGSGTMGAGIAALAAEAGQSVVLLDVDQARCDAAIARLQQGKRPALSAAGAARISCGSIDDNLNQISDCDWICEAIIEDLQIKQDLFSRIDGLRRADSLVSTNTSGIPLAAICEGQSGDLQRNIAVTHFFNPPHIMKLVELVPSSTAHDDVLPSLAAYLEGLGKGAVYAKDTVNFIGNRIGCFFMLAGLHLARPYLERGLAFEDLDAVTSKPIGLPGTGLFGLIDLIGLDIMQLVGANLEANLPLADEGRRYVTLPDYALSMFESGQLGRKSGAGFYRLERAEDGSKTQYTWAALTGQWAATQPVTLSEAEQALSTLIDGDSPRAQFISELLITTLCYAADLVPEIADDIVNVDRALRWGFGWSMGPFEMIDAIGAEKLIDHLTQTNRRLPRMLECLRQAQAPAFYQENGTQFLTTDGKYQQVC